MAVASRKVDLASARAGCVVYLVERTKIALTGEDRVRWLNGVVTNDVTKIAGAQYACALTEKGKVIADVIITSSADALGVWPPSAVAPTLVTHWDRYIIMDDVEVAIDDQRRLLAVQGDGAEKAVAGIGLRARAAKYDDLGIGGVILEVDRSEAEEILHRLEKVSAIAIEDGDVHTLRVEAARATFGFDFDDKSLVQEAGLEGRAVSFTKGCYHGQEVVCMLENRGHVNKRLVQLRIDPGAPVQAGAEVVADAPVGRVTSIVPHADGSAVALAVVKVAHAHEGAKLRVGDRSAQVVALTQ